MESIKKNFRTFRPRTFGLLLSFMLSAFSFRPCHAQAYEIEQLLLDVEKLTQFKAILSDMRQGYTILTQGYGQVKDLAQGNFSLHQVFLDGLLKVNPEVAKYARVADIIADEASILSEYKRAYKRFNNSGLFKASELDYIASVYSNLTGAALNNINELADIITASRLRMSDDERLSAIDRIYADTNDKLQFLRSFNRRTSMLQIQRQQEQNDVQTLQNLYHP
ncbi:MAG: TerB family tellurite resistance protein [Mucilaginibacter sp.]|uniref:TerB family tellurite resistance protein n=1 Tax=Mucilaginibacter sp. TaxID=1882438 RepID=UPI0032663012